MGDGGLGGAVGEKDIDHVKWEIDGRNQQHLVVSFCITRSRLRNLSSICSSSSLAFEFLDTLLF